MCNWVILFLLFCNGGLGNSGSDRGISCGNSGRSNDWGNGSGRGNNNDDCGCNNNGGRGGRGNDWEDRDNGSGRSGGYDNRDWEYDRNRSGNTPPPWVRSNYSNGDTCGCEEQ